MPYTFEDVIAHESECNWKKISQELWRVYTYVYEWGVHQVEIINPVALDVRASGAHIVVDEDGIATYVTSGWLTIEWENHEESSRATF